MSFAKTIGQTLSELRAVARRPRRAQRPPDLVVPLARLLTACRTLDTEERERGFAVRLLGTTEAGDDFELTCVVHDPRTARRLTEAERSVAQLLCEGKTLAQVAQLRGVSPNTVKTQVRQIFRKLNVESRVALVRRLCP